MSSIMIFEGCLDSNHREDRVLSFFSSRPIWDPPPPHPLANVPPLWFERGGTHSLVVEGGGKSDEGTYTVVF